MSLEEKVVDLTKTIELLTAAVALAAGGKVAAAPVATGNAPSAEAQPAAARRGRPPSPTPPAPAAAAQAPAPAAAPAAPAGVAYDAVKAKILECATKVGRSKVEEVLAKFGVTTGKDLKPEQWQEALAAFTAALDPQAADTLA